MTKLTKREVERALISAESKVTSEKRSRGPSGNERAAARLITEWARKSGMDYGALTSLQKKQQVELDDLIEKRRREDAKRVRPDKAQAAITNQAQLFQQSAVGGFFPSPSVTLSAPEFILASPDSGIIRNSHIADFNSVANVLIDTKRSRVDKLSFIFPWQNNSIFPSVVDGTTFLSASGRLNLRQSGVLSLSAGYIFVDAHFEVMALGPQPTIIKSETRNIAAIEAISHPLWIDGHNEGTFSEGYNFSATHLGVAPEGRVLFIVSVTVDCDFDPGRAVADLSAGAFGIHCPLVVVSMRGLPPPVNF